MKNRKYSLADAMLLSLTDHIKDEDIFEGVGAYKDFIVRKSPANTHIRFEWLHNGEVVKAYFNNDKIYKLKNLNNFNHNSLDT